MVTKTCIICGEKFTVKNYRADTAQYCSRQCAGKGKTFKQRVGKYCAICGKRFLVKLSRANDAKYCSWECAAKSRKGANNCNYKGGKMEFTCEWCGKTYTKHPSRKGRTRFCSEKCRREYVKDLLSGEDSPFWQGGCEDYRGPNWPEQREKALNRDNYNCQKCGLSNAESKEQYGYSLTVHHIKPYREFDGDYKQANRLDNLITVCISCHHKVEHKLYL